MHMIEAGDVEDVQGDSIARVGRATPLDGDSRYAFFRVLRRSSSSEATQSARDDRR